jgi:hypothetical protein
MGKRTQLSALTQDDHAFLPSPSIPPPAARNRSESPPLGRLIQLRTRVLQKIRFAVFGKPPSPFIAAINVFDSTFASRSDNVA